ncbi:MAG TPA: serine/threonine-protein kinase [Planctomycetaceae bacterium]|nr:serine/threonine-protein kinase [Planctomycetaceae bacterium]
MNNEPSFESLILEFERAWQRGDEPDIGNVLRRYQDTEDRQRLLAELICVDLEFRWRAADSTPARLPWTLADYLAKFAELPMPLQLQRDLIAEEYRVRRRWGDKPSLNQFARAYEEQHPNIRAQLERVDRELRNELDDLPKTTSRIAREKVPDTRPPVIPDSLAPLSYGDYLLQEMLGAGRFGRVYRSWQRSLGRPVALKYLRKSFQQDPEAVERFIGEARTVSQLQHPGIVPIHGVGKTPGGGYFLAMDLVPGGDLSHRITRGQVSIAAAVRWMVEACEALEHAHQHGIIHCDLKPANLLLNERGQVRVTDFGLARSIGADVWLSERIEGTCGFMAPEQVSGWWGSISPRTDVYGVGAVLFNLLTAEPPYRGATLADVLAQVVSGVAVRSPNELRPDLPVQLNNICVRCLEKSPDDRCMSARQLGIALSDALTTIR